MKTAIFVLINKRSEYMFQLVVLLTVTICIILVLFHCKHKLYVITLILHYSTGILYNDYTKS